MFSVHKVKRSHGQHGLAVMLLILLIFRAQGQSARRESQQNPPLQRTKITDYKRDGKKGCTATCYQATTERGGAKSEGTFYAFEVKGDPKIIVGGGSGGVGGGDMGSYPSGNLAKDSSGNVYGTAQRGGTSKCGVVFEVTGSGYEVIYNFQKLTSDGCSPVGGVVLNNGSLFGTTSEGGEYGEGAVFELSPPQGKGGWQETILYNFCSLAGCSDGATPLSSLAIDPNGNLYGTTEFGGDSSCKSGCGTVFELSPDLNANYSETNVYAFGGFSYGVNPVGGVVLSQGSVFGTTSHGGLKDCHKGCGLIYQLSASLSSSSYNPVHALMFSEGAAPVATLFQDAEGNLYGTASEGGVTGPCSTPATLGCGTVFEVSVGGVFSVLYQFVGGSDDGATPKAPLAFDAEAGVFLGTTTEGGGSQCAHGFGCGTVFELVPPQPNGMWTEAPLLSFTGSGGSTPGESPQSSITLPN